MTEENKQKVFRYTEVGGWLLLFCIALTIISPLRTLYNLVSSYNELEQFFEIFPGIKNLLYIDGFLSISLMILSIRAGIALWQIKPGAVKMGKDYLLYFLGYAIIATMLPFMIGLPAEANKEMIPEVIKGAIQSILYFAIWFSYLKVSIRVKDTYPEFFETPPTQLTENEE